MQVNGNELDRENVRKKFKDKKTTIQNVILLIIISGYIFFFASNWIFSKKSQVYYTPIGEEQHLGEERKISVKEWQYSPQQALMEVQLKIENNSLDGIDSYFYTSSANFLDATKGTTKLPTIVKIEDVDFAVIWIKKVPEDFNSCSLDIFTPDKKEYVQVFTVKDKVEVVNKVSIKSYDEYKIQEIENNIEIHNKRIKSNNIAIEKLNKEIGLLNVKIENERRKQKYMTASEIVKSEKIIENYNDEIKDRQEEITENQDKNIKHRNRITEYEELISRIKNSS